MKSIEAKGEGSFLVMSFLPKLLIMKFSNQPVKTLGYRVCRCVGEVLLTCCSVITMTGSDFWNSIWKSITDLVWTFYVPWFWQCMPRHVSQTTPIDSSSGWRGNSVTSIWVSLLRIVSIVTIKANTDSLLICFHDYDFYHCRHLPLNAAEKWNIGHWAWLINILRMKSRIINPKMLKC